MTLKNKLNIEAEIVYFHVLQLRLTVKQLWMSNTHVEPILIRLEGTFSIQLRYDESTINASRCNLRIFSSG